MADETSAIQDVDEREDDRSDEQPYAATPSIVPPAAPAIQPMPRGQAPAIASPAAMAPPPAARTPLNTTMPGTVPAAPINPAVPPAAPSGAAAAGNAARQNPFAALMANERAIHNPVARVLHRMAQMSPEVRQEEERREEFAVARPGNEAEQAARTRNLNSEADARTNPKPKWVEIAGGVGPNKEVLFRDENGIQQGTYVNGPNGMEKLGGTPAPEQPVAGPPQTVARMPSPANGAGGGAQTPVTSTPRPGVATVRDVAPKESEFKPYTVDGKEVLGQEVNNRIIDPSGKDITSSAVPYEKPPAAKENRFEEVPIGGAMHKVEIGADGKIAKDWGLIPLTPAQQNAETNPGWAFDPATKQKVLTTQEEAKQKGFTNFVKAQGDSIEKDEGALRQMNDVQLNVSRYKQALNSIPGNISEDHVGDMTRIISDKKLDSIITNGATLGVVMDQISQGEQARAWNDLTPQEQNAVTGYFRAKGSIIAYQKALSGSSRTSKEGLEIEMGNLPSPVVGATVANPRFDAFQENIDTASQGFGRVPWLETPADVRKRIEGNAPAAGAERGKPAKLVNGVWTDATTGKPIQ